MTVTEITRFGQRDWTRNCVKLPLCGMRGDSGRREGCPGRGHRRHGPPLGEETYDRDAISWTTSSAQPASSPMPQPWVTRPGDREQ